MTSSLQARVQIGLHLLTGCDLVTVSANVLHNDQGKHQQAAIVLANFRKCFYPAKKKKKKKSPLSWFFIEPV